MTSYTCTIFSPWEVLLVRVVYFRVKFCYGFLPQMKNDALPRKMHFNEIVLTKTEFVIFKVRFN